MAAEEASKWRVIESEMRFDDGHVAVVTEKLSTPTRSSPCPWTTVQRKLAVVVAPMTEAGKLVLIRQERIPIRSTIWEFPAGQVDELCDTGSFRDVALRELKEETGYELQEGGELTLLGDFFSSPGFTNERGFLLMATPVRMSRSGHAHEESEAIIDCREFTVTELTDMIASEEVRDANTLALFARLFARGLLPNE